MWPRQNKAPTDRRRFLQHAYGKEFGTCASVWCPIRFRLPNRTAQLKAANSEFPTCNCCQQLTRHDLGDCGFCRVSAVACQTHHKLLHKFSQLIVAEFWEQIQTARPSHITVYTVRLAYTVNTHFVTILCIRPTHDNPSYFTSQPAKCLNKQLRAQFTKPTYLLHRFVVQHIYYYYYYYYRYFYICDASFT